MDSGQAVWLLNFRQEWRPLIVRNHFCPESCPTACPSYNLYWARCSEDEETTPREHLPNMWYLMSRILWEKWEIWVKKDKQKQFSPRRKYPPQCKTWIKKLYFYVITSARALWGCSWISKAYTVFKMELVPPFTVPSTFPRT